MTMTDDTLSAATVAAWLTDHPDFLADHPELLERLRIPHATDGTSLIEHQVSVLQDKVAELKGRLQQYRETAARNESLLASIHSVQLEMLQAGSVNELLSGLQRRLEQEFRCQHVSLGLFDPEGLTDHAIVVSLAEPSARELFSELAGSDEPVCGRLRRERLVKLFGDRADAVQSAAVATLDRQVLLGLLALGSTDPDKFYPGMGTLFLSLLSQTLGHCLALHLPELQQQRA